MTGATNVRSGERVISFGANGLYTRAAARIACLQRAVKGRGKNVCVCVCGGGGGTKDSGYELLCERDDQKNLAEPNLMSTSDLADSSGMIKRGPMPKSFQKTSL